MNQQIISPANSVEDRRKIELENFIVNFINRIIKFDVDLGRSEQNYYPGDYNAITKNIDEFRKNGFRIFLGGGNAFFLKTDKKLDGWKSICVQVRGMARRKIVIKEINNEKCNSNYR